MDELNITSAKYTDDENNNHVNIAIIVDGKTLWVPLEEGNRHYDEIMRQVEAGELTIQEAD